MKKQQAKKIVESFIQTEMKKNLREEPIRFANYYKNELSKLDTSTEYPCNLVIIDGNGNKTKHLNLNSDSIPIIINWLKSIQ